MEQYYRINKIVISGSRMVSHDRHLTEVPHATFSGLAADDHTQYHNDTRGDTRYYTKTLLDAGQLDNRYYTETEVDSLLASQDEFIELDDTPSSYIGANNYDVVVSGSELVFKNDRTLTDGSRPFTSTVAGVDPVDDYDLVTLGYLINLLDPTQSGSVGNITFGSYFDYEIDESISSTNSTTYQEKISLDLDPVAFGGYRVGWHFEWRMSKQNEQFNYRVQLDDTTNLIETSKSPFVDVNEWQGITNFYYFPTLASGSHNIHIDYSSSNTGATAYIRSARIEFWRVI